MSRVPPGIQAPTESKKTAEIQNPAENQQHAPAAVPSSHEPVRDDRRKMSRVPPGIRPLLKARNLLKLRAPLKTSRLPLPLFPVNQSVMIEMKQVRGSRKSRSLLKMLKKNL